MVFVSEVVVNDNPQNISERKENVADIKVTVVSSEKQFPTFVDFPTHSIYIKENFSDINYAIATITAQSNIRNEEIQFQLVKGQTAQTNKDATFQLTSMNSTTARLTLGRRLDYEVVTEYQLTVKILNKDSLASSKLIAIKVEDVNDEIPYFLDLVTGSVLENEEPGSEVMQV